MVSWVKVFKGFRFDPGLYEEFKIVAGRSGLMVTETFEKFMRACVEVGAVKFPDAGRKRSGVEAEARVLLAWLRKGQTWHASADEGEEVSVHGKLLQMISQVEDEALRKEIEEELKKS